MSDLLIARILLILVFAICGWSLWKGGASERAGALLALANTLASLALTDILNPVVKLTLDGVTALAFVGLAIRFTNKWLGVVMLLYGAQFGLNAYYFVMARERDLAYNHVNNTIFLFVCMSLAAGVIGYIRGSRTAEGAA